MSSAAQVSLPSGFIRELAAATSRECVLAVTAKWMPEIMKADRSSVSLPVDGVNLQIYALTDGLIRPQGKRLPVNGSLAGQAFNSQEVVLVDDEYAVRITAIIDPNNPH